MSPDTQFSGSGRRRRVSRTATAAALLLVAEAALVAGGAAVTAAPQAEEALLRSHQPSEGEILASDMAWAARHAKGSKAWAILEAERIGKKVVVTDETTETTYTVANPDGTLTTELTAGPERVLRDGKWQKVDVTLARGADGGVRAKSHPKGLRLGGKGDTRAPSLRAAKDAAPRDLVTLGEGDESVTLQWKGGLPAPAVDGATARYREAVPGADVVVEATRTGFEQFVEIRERPETAGYTYTLPVKAKGLKAEANNDGSVTFTDARTGDARATMPAPVMWDASVDKRSGKHENRTRVGMKVVDRGNGLIDLVVTPDAAFLADPKTVYPVTVDPSTSALSNTFDTYVQQGETVDWSADTELDLGNPGTKNADGTFRTARSFITWNTSAIADALIVDTNLSLYNFHSGNTDCTAQSWTVWDTGAPSTASRWTSQPAWNQQYHSSTETKGNPSCGADGWINADVDALVQTWASAKASRGHMGLRAATDDVKQWKRVNSANATTNQPKLSVTYNYRPSDGTNRQAGAPFRQYAGVWAVNTTTPTLRDTFTDADGDKVTATFQVYDAATNTPITTPAGEGLIVSDSVDSGKPASVTVPAGQLQDGRTYKFRTNAYDGTHYNLNWSAWTQFVVDTTAPEEPESVTSSTYPENWGGGGAGIEGRFDVTTGDPSPYEVQYRFDPYEDDADDYGWASVRTTTPTARAAAPAPEASYTATPAADGNHVTQTRTVDRAGNVGPIRDYGFTAGNRDYNRAQKIDIKLPQPDLTSDAAAYLNEPQRIADWKQGSASRTLSKGDETVTITPKDERSLAGTRKAAKELAERSRMRAPSYPDPIVTGTWCQPSLSGEAQKSLITRNEACVFFDLNYEKEYYLHGVKIAEHHASFEIAFQVKTDRNDGTIKTWIEMNPVYNDFPGDERSVLFGDGNPIAHIDSMCFSSACEDATDGKDVQNFDFYGDLSWKGGGDSNPVDSHMATGTATHKWDGSTDGAGPTDAGLSRKLPIWFVYNPESEYVPIEGKDDDTDGGDARSPGIDVRCDKVESYGDPGCVLTQYVPEYQMDAARYPAAAAHLWMVQNKSGVKGLGTIAEPMHYRPDADNGRVNSTWTKKKIRARVCGYYGGSRTDGYVPTKGFVPHPKTFLHPEFRPQVPLPNPDKVNCDEVPFASAYETVGLPATAGGLNPAGKAGGGECIQTVAAKADDGSEHLLDDTRYDAPAFTEKCGRSSMSGYVNQGAMNKYGNEFLSRMRVIDGDAFAVDPGRPWFKDCDTGAATLVCEMKKP
ncbi:DNRLRE domain-containing protein [Streptomyces toyocaensis]|uniref:DNRLRE domain-containing protein n=2 Tax=Streptomyces toyocaensis TaxID=55952 RepID=UPI000B250B86|nr:DNRLRE domain-containing protein [Streptomyces toyocaensis]